MRILQLLPDTRLFSCSLFMYDRKGKVEVDTELDEESVLEAAIEAGVDDYEIIPGDEKGSSILLTDPKEVSLMNEAIHSLGHKETKMSLGYISKAPVEVSEEEFESNMGIIEALEGTLLRLKNDLFFLIYTALLSHFRWCLHSRSD